MLPFSSPPEKIASAQDPIQCGFESDTLVEDVCGRYYMPALRSSTPLHLHHNTSGQLKDSHTDENDEETDAVHESAGEFSV